ncbi:S-adenosyl-L-methionine-dependent methyltransferase [Lentinula lateritia]|uniref:S-adenosyl-L-methionine-dependent methyltransferase n=1 Tax=Lentinula aff. lateritia TaxID=2804960 RepID=A0ACC1UFJ4_9AGAR|nr:S-adenosyl-L-methionine-dependent methyltransferase [Lentinula aff. lateritia]KAJ3857653.1 S-adenosyl-L-methionine-dependent methyltransferase [Lentinula lateritia]
MLLSRSQLNRVPLVARLGILSQTRAVSDKTSTRTPRLKKTTLLDFAQPKQKRVGSRFETHPDSPEDKTNLPPRDKWRQIFAWVPVNDRVSLSNSDTANTVAECFVPKGSTNKVIIEAFPGPGQLTRSLLALPKKRIKRLIVLEQEPKYLDYLRPLAALDPRLTIIPYTALEWDTFDRIEEQGLLEDIETLEWDQGVHPILQFISHLPITVYGEQLIAQILRLIPNRNWLFKFGRVKMNLLLSEYVWQRLTAPPENALMRCKLSVMATATADFQTKLYDELQPYAQHFHPTLLKKASDTTKFSNRRVGIPFQAVEITPLVKQVINPEKLDTWDYCIRRLYVRKATPLNQCIEDLGPGAQSLIPKLSATIDPKTKIREITVSQWASIVKEFDEWPFAPTDLGINDAKLDNYGGRGLLNRF